MNLLIDPIFRTKTCQGTRPLNLPALLAALGQNEVESLPGLQRHQEDPFHIFLCYLAAAVLDRQGTITPSQDEHFWRDGIRHLTGRDDDTAWTLVVEDVTKPAFMQPALTSRALFETLIPKATTPDELDVLQLAKNHDVKSHRTIRPGPEDWIYSLITLQTTVGHMGRGNYGIARMNSGTGSRVCIGLVYENTLGGRWIRDTNKLLEYRPTILGGAWSYRSDGLVLTWIRPWDLKTSLTITDLDPFFIESARARRLIFTNQGITALGGNADTTRHVNAEAFKGNMGDPWAPIVDGGDKAWTARAPVFSPKNIRNMIFNMGSFITPFMLEPDREKGACHFKGSVLVPNGMGKTDGFHEAEIPIGGKASFALFSGGKQRDLLSVASEEGLSDAKIIQNKVLKVALFSLLEAGPEKVDFDKREVSAWVDKSARDFTKAWSNDYFDWLWRTLDHEDKDQARLEWLNALKEKAVKVLENAINRLPERQGRHYRAKVHAQGLFYGSLYKHFPELKEQRDASQSA
jgi:CRISPR system Cascade subunit CasA